VRAPVPTARGFGRHRGFVALIVAGGRFVTPLQDARYLVVPLAIFLALVGPASLIAVLYTPTR